MKKTITICWVILLSFMLFGCGESDKKPTTSPKSDITSSNQKENAGNNTVPSDQENDAPTHEGRGDLIDSNDSDPGQGDPGDTKDLQWWGEYKNEDTGFAIEITEYSGTDFWADITLLRNGHTILAGKATISAEDNHLAVFGDIGFYLYEDFSAIDIVGSESSEWVHMRGQYKRIE